MTGSKWTHKTQVAWVGGACRAVVLDLDRPEQMPLVLEDTAADIWLALQEPKSVDDASALLSEQYSEDPADLREPVAQFIQQLAALGVIMRA